MNRIAKWRKWLERIEHDVQSALMTRTVFLDLQSAIRSNEKLHRPSYLYSYLRNTYAAHVGMTIRRQIKDMDNSVSLARLLREISEHSHLISREHFTSLYAGSSAESLADTDFNNLAGIGSKYFPASNVLEDLTALRSHADVCENYLDRVFAHLDKRAPSRIPTYNEIHAAVDLLDQICVKYERLLNARGMDSLNPTFQDDWKAVLRVPWIET